MHCWECGRVANGVCKFCGRAVCKVHVKDRAFLIAAWEETGMLRGLGVENALYCGVCNARPEPVTLDFIRSGRTS